MKINNQKINKKMFRTILIIYSSLGVAFYILTIYLLYIGLKEGVLEGFDAFVIPLWLFIIFPIFITILMIIIKGGKSKDKKGFFIISIMAIIAELILFNFALYVLIDVRSEISINRLKKQEYELSKNANSYKECADMTYYIDRCANTVNEKTGDLQGCINLSIDYAKKGGICQAGEFLKDDPICLKGFACIKKNTRTFDGHKWNGSNLDSLLVGYADGTYKCEANQYHYCPPTEQ
ncbi:hypothetical protein KKH39_01450 [Patescibacteria group bacterium]|nr:hypothetical protein [Patescibacteria group bacterium]